MPHTQRDPRIVPGVIIRAHNDNPNNFGYYRMNGRPTQFIVLDVVRHDKYMRDSFADGSRDPMNHNDIEVVELSEQGRKDFQTYWKDFWNPKRKCRNWSKISSYPHSVKSQWFDFESIAYPNPMMPPSNRMAAKVHLKRDIIWTMPNVSLEEV